jgi:serine/threonine-protein kinase
VRDPALWSDKNSINELVQSAVVETESVQLLFALAERLRDKGGDAVPFLRRVQAAHPGDFWSNSALGDALVRGGNPVDAIRYCQSALALRPTAVVAHCNLASALALDNRIDDAMECLREALRINPNFALAHSSLGNCLELKGRFAEALEQQREAVRIDPESAENHSNLAVALQDVGRIADAMAELQKALEIDPRDAGAYQNLGNVQAISGRGDKAIEAFREAANLMPEDAYSYSILGRALAKMNHMDEALEALERAVQLRPDSAVFRSELGAALAQLGRVDEAFEMHRQALALDPKSTDSTKFLRQELIRAGRAQQTCTLWQKALAGDPPDFEARDGYAELCLFLERTDEYRHECTILLDRFGPRADARIAERIAEACLLMPASDADVESAAALVERARPDATFLRGLLEYRRNRLDAAVPIFQKAATGEEVPIVGRTPILLLALIAQRQGDDRGARKLLATGVYGIDWRTANAAEWTSWMWHAIRREAETAIVPNASAILDGTDPPRDNDERLALMGLCESKCLYHVAARLCADAFALDASLVDNRQMTYRYNAACYAALAGSEDGRNAIHLGDDERAAWRTQARRWLRDEITKWSKSANGSAQVRDIARQQLANFRQDADLAGLRDPEQLAKLSQAERDECNALWSEVDRMLDSMKESR